MRTIPRKEFDKTYGYKNHPIMKKVLSMAKGKILVVDFKEWDIPQPSTKIHYFAGRSGKKFNVRTEKVRGEWVITRIQ